MINPIVGELAQWAVFAVVAGGSIWTWRKNGKDTEYTKGKMAEKMANLEKFAGEADLKMDKILEGQNRQENHCATVSSDLAARVTNLEKDTG